MSAFPPRSAGAARRPRQVGQPRCHVTAAAPIRAPTMTFRRVSRGWLMRRHYGASNATPAIGPVNETGCTACRSSRCPSGFQAHTEYRLRNTRSHNHVGNTCGWLHRRPRLPRAMASAAARMMRIALCLAKPACITAKAAASTRVNLHLRRPNRCNEVSMRGNCTGIVAATHCLLPAA